MREKRTQAFGVKPAESVLRAALAEAAANAARLEALPRRRLASAGAQGQTPQRKRGQGEDFWQFRPYQTGESAAAIDWRRSARDSHIYIRDKQRETAQTAYLAPDLSASMLYQSPTALCSKQERALTWLFMLAQLCAKNGGRVAVPQLLPPSADRNAAENIAAALLHSPDYPQKSGIEAGVAAAKRFADVFFISDFLDDVGALQKALACAAENQCGITLIRIADPAEIRFPFHGDTLFQDPETGQSRFYGQAQKLRAAYQARYRQHKDAVAECAAAYGAALLDDETDQPLQNSLEKLNALLSDD